MNSGRGVTLELPPKEPEEKEAQPTLAESPLVEVQETFGGLPAPEWKNPAQRRVEGYWYKTPCVPDQALTYPETVSKGPFQTQILWLDQADDAERYAEILNSCLKDGTHIEVGVLERQFVTSRDTWVVLAVFRPILYRALMSM